MSITAPQARVTDPITSHAAAASVDNLSSTQERILEIISWHGKASDEVIYHTYRARHGYISSSGARTRRKELCDVALVVDSGDRWLTESGRESIVWTIPPKPPCVDACGPDVHVSNCPNDETSR